VIKILSMMKRQEHLSIQEFRTWAIEVHAEIGRRMPEIRHYKVSVVTDENAESPFDAVMELYFDTVEAFKAALDSPVGAEAGADIKAHCKPDRYRLITEETVIVP
jgi:uncharacterized protein (TIGR02118 family)